MLEAKKSLGKKEKFGRNSAPFYDLSQSGLNNAENPIDPAPGVAPIKEAVSEIRGAS